MNALAAFTAQTNSIAALSAAFDGRKVTADDVWNSNRDRTLDLACRIVDEYTGTFPFMLNMREHIAAGCTLTDAQVAGILNAAISDYRYQQRHAAVKQAEEVVTSNFDTSKQYVPDGWYTIVGKLGGHRTLRLQTVEPSEKYPNQDGVKQWLAYLSGADNVGDYTTIGWLHGNAVILLPQNQGKFQDIVKATYALVKNVDKLGEFGKAYAVRSGKCYRCNRKLTTPKSIRDGIGPKCATLV